MNFHHDPLRHLKYFRQSLSQSDEPIAFFLAAGCPLSVPMPEGEWPLIADVENLTAQIAEELADSAEFVRLTEELTKAGKSSANIEDILSFLRSLRAVSAGGEVRGFKEDELTQLESLICQKIVTKIDVQLPEQQTPYHRLGNWIRSIDRKSPIEVFTTNYDLLLEQALEGLEIPYFDGFVGAQKSFFDLRAVEDSLIPIHWTRVWKIHGSINWYQDSTNEMPKVLRSSEVHKDAAHLIYPSHLKYDESRKMPFLALTDQLNRFIRRKSSLLIICGYSFSDTHLNNTIESALQANPTGMVLALMYGTYMSETGDGVEVERYPKAYQLAQRQHNLNVWTFDQAIIGTNRAKWQTNPNTEEDDEREIRDFVDQGVGEDETKQIQTVTLGDFSRFSEFLTRMITIASGKTNV